MSFFSCRGSAEALTARVLTPQNGTGSADAIAAYVHFTYYSQHHYVSMCQDIHNKRPTEIDTINGYIVKESKRLGIPTPVNETLMHLVRLISNHYADQWKD